MYQALLSVSLTFLLILKIILHSKSPSPSLSFVFFLGLPPWHMEVPRLGVELELQPLVYTTATATPDPSHVCDLHPSSWQHWILNPLSEARGKPVSSWILVRFVSAEPQQEL